MKRLLSALASATALALVMCPPAFADDDDDDYTPITDCGTVITEPGHYKLMNNLVGCDVPDPMGDTIEYGIGIFSDDVVLDLNDHAISCLHGDQQGSNFYNFGVFTQEFRARIEILGGAVTGCNIGVIMNQRSDS